MKKIKKILVIIALILLATPLLVFAQTQTNPCTAAALKGKGTDAAKTALPTCISQIYKWSLGIAVILALLMMVLGGYYIMTARGNAEQATKGKEFIESALIGVVLLFAAWLILNEINPDFVDFKLNSLDSLNQQQQQQPENCRAPRVC